MSSEVEGEADVTPGSTGGARQGIRCHRQHMAVVERILEENSAPAAMEEKIAFRFSLKTQLWANSRSIFQYVYYFK